MQFFFLTHSITRLLGSIDVVRSLINHLGTNIISLAGTGIKRWTRQKQSNMAESCCIIRSIVAFDLLVIDTLDCTI